MGCGARRATRGYLTHTSLPEEHQMLQETCQSFSEKELAPYAGDWDKNHTFPAEPVRCSLQREDPLRGLIGYGACIAAWQRASRPFGHLFVMSIQPGRIMVQLDMIWLFSSLKVYSSLLNLGICRNMVWLMLPPMWKLLSRRNEPRIGGFRALLRV